MRYRGHYETTIFYQKFNGVFENATKTLFNASDFYAHSNLSYGQGEPEESNLCQK